MATVVTEYVEKYTLDPSGYVKGAQVVHRTTTNLADDSAKKASSGFSTLESAGKTAFSTIATAGGLALGAVTALGAAGAKAFTDYAGFESLTKALEAIEGSAGAAASAMADLKRISQQPGLGFEESVRGYSGLRRAGLSREFSERTVSEAGNANAMSGGSKETFGQILLALQQIAVKPFLQGDELLQLMEAGIAAPKMLKDEFGTADGEELKKRGITSQMALQGLVNQMAKLPRVAGGAQNTLDNFFDSLHFASVNAGSGLLQAAGGLTSLSTTLDKFTEAGVWKIAMEGFADAVGLTALNAEGGEGFLSALAVEFMMAGYYASNFVNNLKDIGSALQDFIYLITAAFQPREAYEHFFGEEKESKGDGISPEDMRARFANEIRLALDLAAKRRQNAGPGGGNGDPLGDPADDPGDAKAMANATGGSKLSDIASNTHRTANASEKFSQMTEMILGGGTVGQAGLSLEDLTDAGVRKTGGRGIRAKLMEVADIIEGDIRKAARGQSRRYADAG